MFIAFWGYKKWTFYVHKRNYFLLINDAVKGVSTLQ